MRRYIFLMNLFCLCLKASLPDQITQESLPTVTENSYNLVFVHIGEAVPSHVVEAIKQARLFNKSCAIYLITNQHVFAKLSEKISASNVSFVDYEKLPMCAEYKAHLTKKARANFWRFGTDRWFLLYELMRQLNLHNSIYIENDVMIYVDFSTLIDFLKDHYNLALPFDSDRRSIMSVLYVKDADYFEPLIRFFVKAWRYELSDMPIPALFRKNGGQIQQLPIIMPEYVEKNRLQNKMGESVAQPEAYSYLSDSISMIFDAAALGQYLGGQDPRNGSAAPCFVNETCVFDPSLLTYSVFYDAENRAIPIASYDGKSYQIADLHIHSKRLHVFSSQGAVLEQELQKIKGQKPWGPVLKSKTTRKIGRR